VEGINANVSDRSCHPSVHVKAERLTGVLDDRNTEAFESLNVCRDAEGVNDDDRPGPHPDVWSYRLGRDVPMLSDVAENGPKSTLENGVTHVPADIGRDDHLCAPR
jgi:hypothetical protein